MNKWLLYGAFIHWTYGEISWKIKSGFEVEFTAQIGWKSPYGFIGSNIFWFGDGNSITLSSWKCPDKITPCINYDTQSTLRYKLLSNTSDLNGVENLLVGYIFYHTYSSAGPFEFFLDRWYVSLCVIFF